MRILRCNATENSNAVNYISSLYLELRLFANVHAKIQSHSIGPGAPFTNTAHFNPYMDR